MIRSTTRDTAAAELGQSSTNLAVNRLEWPSLLLLSVWSGLVAGLLEVATFLVRKQFLDADQVWKTSRHFIWMTPLANLCVCLTVGIVGTAAMLACRGRGRWLVIRVLAAFMILPVPLVGFPHLYSLASLLLALGAAFRLVPTVERHNARFRQLVRVSLPLLIALVSAFAMSVWITDRARQSLENARPLPPAGSPNVILLVMDTVAADHSSVNGYARATTTTLAELADRGIRFDSARSPSSWTLPSHATMFTGRWLHELGLGWLTPLDNKFPTVAEYLADHGYATAGFVANTYFCGADSGLARGFTHYEDYIFPNLTFLKTSVIVTHTLDGAQIFVYFLEDLLEATGTLTAVQSTWDLFEHSRKHATELNAELLDWLSNRPQPERPFFAFLNYYDAHYPYQLSPGRLHRFGVEPDNQYQRVLIQHWWEVDKSTVSKEGVAFAVDSYDDCIADLDEQLGKLIDQLDRRGILETTWLIVVSDHGESFGEHPNIFCHGSSLYETEVHVPLLIIPPASTNSPTRLTISEPVSLRDMAATIVDITGLDPGAPFAGESFTRFWTTSPKPDLHDSNPALPTLSELAPNDPKDRDYWGAPKPLLPRASIKNNEWSYIRREGDVREELFQLTLDPREQRNLADDPVTKTTLEQFRATLNKLTEGPLLPARFKP